MEIEHASGPGTNYAGNQENCDLTWDTSHLSQTVSDIESRNCKWKDEFDRDQIETVERLQEDMLEEQNYELEHVK